MSWSSHAMLFAAALAAVSLNVAAQTSPPAPAETTQTFPPPVPAPRKVCGKPVYPVQALRNEWTGKVTIAFLIGVDGAVKDAKIVKSSGHDVLDEAARDSLSQCRFKPATVDGKAQEAWQPVQYVWTLD
jgi:TonB family protein